MISILRLGHRIGRDARLSTHCGLAARALGADEITYSGEEDKELIESVKDTAKRWGGSFCVRYANNWQSVIKNYKKKKFCAVHLTMYGMPLQKKISTLRKKKNILLIVGSGKVPGEVYGLADFNIAVTSQPHSEVAAMSIFLHEYFRGRELDKRFGNAKIRIKPQERGKKFG